MSSFSSLDVTDSQCQLSNGEVRNSHDSRRKCFPSFCQSLADCLSAFARSCQSCLSALTTLSRAIPSCCWLLCCPPCPNNIASKIAFIPPPSSYEIKPTDNKEQKLRINYKGEWAVLMEQNTFKTFLETKISIDLIPLGNRLSSSICMCYMRCSNNPRFYLVYSHGNACDLGMVLPLLYVLGTVLQCDMIAYDYPGYGESHGQPSEQSIKQAIAKVYGHFVEKYLKSQAIPADRKIVLFGQSIGSVPTCYLASKENVAGVILQSAICTGLHVLCHCVERRNSSYCCDVFNNYDCMSQINCPTLLIHGRHDQLIPHRHAMKLYAKLDSPVDPLWLMDGEHNELEYKRGFIDRLLLFINRDLPRALADSKEEADRIHYRVPLDAHTLYMEKVRSILQAPSEPRFIQSVRRLSCHSSMVGNTSDGEQIGQMGLGLDEIVVEGSTLLAPVRSSSCVVLARSADSGQLKQVCHLCLRRSPETITTTITTPMIMPTPTPTPTTMTTAPTTTAPTTAAAEATKACDICQRTLPTSTSMPANHRLMEYHSSDKVSVEMSRLHRLVGVFGGRRTTSRSRSRSRSGAGQAGRRLVEKRLTL